MGLPASRFWMGLTAMPPAPPREDRNSSRILQARRVRWQRSVGYKSPLAPLCHRVDCLLHPNCMTLEQDTTVARQHFVTYAASVSLHTTPLSEEARHDAY